jgi:isopentenyl phosphate kinase
MLIFLKLGGSLITNKDIPFSARKETLKQLGSEILKAIKQIPNLRLLIGHGSGSFGHTAAVQFRTRSGIHSPKDWLGFQKVWWAAHRLNQIVVEEFSYLGLPIISMPASASLISSNQQVSKWMIEPITTILKNQLIPMVFGDVVIDKEIGATIFSTEELFSYLVKFLHPKRILLAGKEMGVFADYPDKHDLISLITPDTYPLISEKIITSSSTDVTGGMSTKVKSMLNLITTEEDLSIDIFSGEEKDNLFRVISGENIGTRLSR